MRTLTSYTGGFSSCVSKPSRSLQAVRRRQMRVRSFRASDSQAERASGGVLEAFYVGRAFAQLLSERVSSAATEVLSELGKKDAEQRQAFREFQEEVAAKARADMYAGSSAAKSQPTGRGSVQQAELVQIPPPDLQAVVDDLRAEVASARATLQVLKSGSTANNSPS